MLDSQILWEELMASAPESLRKAVETSRTGVDFLVSSTYFSGLLSLLSLLFSLLISLHLLSSDPSQVSRLLLTAAAAGAIAPISYGLAVLLVDVWKASVRGLVNLGRIPLAQALGLTIPVDPDEERQMWEVVDAFVREKYEPESAPYLMRYRAAQSSPIGKAPRLGFATRLFLPGAAALGLAVALARHRRVTRQSIGREPEASNAALRLPGCRGASSER